MVASIEELERRPARLAVRAEQVPAELRQETDDAGHAQADLVVQAHPEFDTILATIRKHVEGDWMLFLVEYDRERGTLVNLTRFDDSDASSASRARLDLELALNRRGVSHEVVLLDAASEQELRRTHRRYFVGIAELTSVSGESPE